MSELEFPRILVSVDKKRSFLSFKQAAVLQASWFQNVEVLSLVLEDDMSVRELTREESQIINDMCDEYEASK